MLNIQTSFSLLSYNTFHIDVQAKYFVEISSLEELQELFTTEIFKQEKKQILGGGSNVLFTQDVEGLVIKVGLKGIEEWESEKGEKWKSWKENQIFVRVWSGENWSDFVEYCNRQGRAGIENLIAIPGNVGTAPISNIWAYGMEVGNRIAWVEGYDLETLEWRKFTHEECEFAYRNSIFKSALRNRFLVTHVTFALERFDEGYVFMVDYPDVQAVLSESPLPPFQKGGRLKHISDIIAEIRARKLPDPNVIGTAGSFFANPFVERQHFETLKKEFPEMPFWITPLGTKSPLPPFPVACTGRGTKGGCVKLSAGRLIEKAGLKGYSNGKAGTSPHHALIVVNDGGSASDVLEVVEYIKQQVQEKFWVELCPEVVFV